jgi:hypothetical protein
VHLVATHVLGRITGDVSRAHDTCRRLAIAANEDNAYRTSHAGEGVLPIETQRLDRTTYGLADFHCPRFRTAREQDAELIAAETCQDIRRPDIRLYDLRDLAQKFVTRRMTESIVDDLELIENEVQQRMRVVRVCLAGFERRNQLVLKLATEPRTSRGRISGICSPNFSR